MHLSKLIIKNFKCFDGNEHIITFKKGLNVIVGENDSGKSAIIDAIRLVLGTTDMNWYKISQEDYYNEDTNLEISIRCKFEDLSDEEQGAFLECLSYVDGGKTAPCLWINWKCNYISSFIPPRSISSVSTGINSNSPAPSSESKELLRATYLHALRDTYSEMKSGRKSRLSQVIQHTSGLDKGKDEYKDGDDINALSLAGIVDLSNTLLANHTAIQSVNREMTSILQDNMLLKQDELKTRLEVAGANIDKSRKIISLLEKLDLAVDKDSSNMRGKVGLGTSNIMSMACELLLHKEAANTCRSCLLLIEEPEAHVHAQRQLKLIQSLENDCKNDNIQTIITTHSPLLTSVVKLSNIIIVKAGNTFSLSPEFTKLDKDDYLFLEKYLDATKANLFFARNVIIVEGPGEALLLPTLARVLGYDFTDYGTSLVDVRSTGLRRYARIFQRENDEEVLDINVACVTDMDVMPNCAPSICINESFLPNDKNTWPDINKRRWRAKADFSADKIEEYVDEIKKKADGQKVKTFVADHWTLEYDLAYKGLTDRTMNPLLITSLMNVSYDKKNRKTKQEELEKELASYSSIEEKASLFYSYFTSKKASKADFAQELAIAIEREYYTCSDKLINALPNYLVKAIIYVTKGDKK